MRAVSGRVPVVRARVLVRTVRTVSVAPDVVEGERRVRVVDGRLARVVRNGVHLCGEARTVYAFLRRRARVTARAVPSVVVDELRSAEYVPLAQPVPCVRLRVGPFPARVERCRVR